MSVPPESPRADRDRLPVWVIALLLVFLSLRVVDLHGLGAGVHGGRLSQTMTGGVDEKTMTALISINSETKLAFAQSLATPGQSAPDRKTLRKTLTTAETLQRDTRNSPSAARRVLVLRSLLGLPLSTGGKDGLDPQLAFSPAALAGLVPDDRQRYAREGQVWADIAAGPHLSPAQTLADADALRRVPNIRWWLYPSLSCLYASQGNARAAGHYTHQAQTAALLTMAPLTFLSLAGLLLGLVGVLLLLYFLALRTSALDASAPNPPPPLALWPTLPETVPLAERRLRAGDLLGVFVLYLLLPDALGLLLGGFVAPHRFHAPGLLAPYRARLAALPNGQYTAVVVALETALYLLSAAVPIAVLFLVARRRRASVGDELGWNTRRLGRNLLYGVGGYAIALPLVLLAGAAGSGLGSRLHAPAPSNPALPLLANAASPWVQAMLVLLAVVAAPLTEEFLFRGVFYNAAKLRLGVWPAIVLTGLLFGFVHPVGVGEMLPLAVLGGVFAWLAETRKSLAPSILGHFLQNSLATLVLLLALAG